MKIKAIKKHQIVSVNFHDVYWTKVMSNGDVEIYGRNQTFFGVITTAQYLEHFTGKPADTWENYTAGRSSEPGDAKWWW